MEEIENLRKLEEALVLYGFKETPEEIKASLPEEKEFVTFRISSKWMSEVEGRVERVTKVISNKRGTVKLVITSGGRCFFLSGQATFSGNLPLIEGAYYSPSRPLTRAWNLVKEGAFLLFIKHSFWKTSSIAFALKVNSWEEVKEWFEILKEANTLFRTYEDEREASKLQPIRHQGEVSLEDVKKLRERVRELAKEIEEIKKEEKKKAREAMESIKMKRTDKGQEITFTGLDGHTYTLRTSSPLESFRREDFFDGIVYVGRERRNIITAAAKSETLVGDIFRLLETKYLPSLKRVVMECNGKEVEISVRRPKGGNFFMYFLDGERVAREVIVPNLKEFFFTDKEEGAWKGKKPRVRKKRWIRKTFEVEGKLVDLEGEFPVSLEFQRVKGKWFLVIGGKKYKIESGLALVRSLSKVLKGKTQRYEDRFSTHEFFNRLQKGMTKKEAIEVISKIKEIGILLRAMQGKGDEN